MIDATEFDRLIADLEAQPEVEGIEDEVAYDGIVSVMSTPPGPLKSKSRVYWHRRPRSGPFEKDWPNEG